MVLAVAFFVWRLPRRKYFALRLSGALVALCGLWYLFLFVIPEVHIVWNIAKYILLFLAFFAGIFFCWKVDFGQASFCAVAGYAVQHVICKINVLLRLIIAMNGKDLLWIYYVFTPCLYALIWLCLAKASKNGSASMHFANVSQIVLSIALLFCTTFVSQVFDIAFCGNDIMVFIAFVALDIIFAVFILIVQFNLYRFAELRHDIAEIERIHRFEIQQMEQTKEMIELINIKSHDLKHQLLRLNGKIEEDEAEELLKSISIYDDTIKTENEALNVVLAQKKLTAPQGVLFTPLIDASGLAKMSDGDVYSLFGNIIDNAFEAAAKLPEERRAVTLVVKNDTGFTSIHIENEYDGEIKFKNNLPQTSKEDKSIHGFGMKSISLLVKKYKGTMSISAEDNVFSLDILLPA